MSVRVRCSAASLRDPGESAEMAVGYEEALGCDGSECGFTVFSEDGELELVQPHWHLIEKGKSPEAGPRLYPICWG